MKNIFDIIDKAKAVKMSIDRMLDIVDYTILVLDLFGDNKKEASGARLVISQIGLLKTLFTKDEVERPLYRKLRHIISAIFGAIRAGQGNGKTLSIAELTTKAAIDIIVDR